MYADSGHQIRPVVQTHGESIAKMAPVRTVLSLDTGKVLIASRITVRTKLLPVRPLLESIA